MLDDEGDDYTLLDFRDTGQVFWQDHETRAVALRHDSLAGFLARAEAKGEKPTARAISTAALCARYQWLVWFLARPLTEDGVPMQTADYLVRCGIGQFRSTWPSRDAVAAGARVRSAVARRRSAPRASTGCSTRPCSPTTSCARACSTRSVIADTDLVRAFVVRLGRLPLSGDLPVVPSFARAARSA